MKDKLNMPGFVTIKKNVLADLQVVVAEDTYSRDSYKLLSLVVSEGIIIEEDCDEEGVPNRNSYREPAYGACRINSDVIEICHPKLGWVPADEKLNDAYREVLANKVLLGETTDG